MFRIGSARSIPHVSRAVIAPTRPLSTFGRLRHGTSRRLPVGLAAPPAPSIVPNATPTQLSIITRSRPFATKPQSGIQQGIDPEEDKKVAQRKLESNPKAVTTESSVRHFYEPAATGEERPVKESVKDDLVRIRHHYICIFGSYWS